MERVRSFHPDLFILILADGWSLRDPCRATQLRMDGKGSLAQVAVRCDWDQAIGNSDMITSAQLGRVVWGSELGGVIN